MRARFRLDLLARCVDGGVGRASGRAIIAVVSVDSRRYRTDETDYEDCYHHGTLDMHTACHIGNTATMRNHKP